MTILKNVIYTRRYTKAGGDEGKEYITVGHVHDGKYGEYLTLYKHINFAAFESKPGDNRITLNLYDPKPREGDRPAAQRQKPAAKAPEDEGFDDEIPF